MIVSGALDLIGNTPLVRLSRIERGLSLNAELYGKLERANIGGSAKDRVALSLIRAAERDGLIGEGGTIIEATSGNTGVGLALVGAVLGYRVLLTMPESMSLERRALLSLYGAKLELTPASEGMNGAVKRAEELAASLSNAFLARQFENPNNPAAHYQTTGQELLDDLNGAPDAFVATIGTGGTISGTGRRLKEANANCYVLGAEPAESPLLTKGQAGSHGIQGIGANFIPKNLDRTVVDEVLPVKTEDAFSLLRYLAKTEGLLCGISSGAALCALVELAKRERFYGKRLVALLPDTGERYLSVL